MSGLNKIYLGIFIVLVVVLVGELGFLFFQSQRKQPPIPTTQSVNALPVPTLTSTPKTPTATDAATVNFMQTEQDVYKNLDALGSYYRSMADKGILISSTLSVKMGGQLVEINDQGGVLPVTNFQYKLKISFKQGNVVQSTYLTEAQAKRIAVVQLVNGKEQPISFTDLKIGDNITIEKTRNMLEPPDVFTELKITKIP